MLASLKMLFFWTNSVSDIMLALEVIILVNSTPNSQLLLIRNPEDRFFSFLRETMHDIPEPVLAVWKLWLTADKTCEALLVYFPQKQQCILYLDMKRHIIDFSNILQISTSNLLFYIP
jgi:hypothetical protein